MKSTNPKKRKNTEKKLPVKKTNGNSRLLKDDRSRQNKANKKNSKLNQPVKPRAKATNHFTVVAIGASAGGIEAISKLLENLSPKLGMAYVIIQHLAPDHESILPELRERKTSMSVHQVEDGMKVKADNVHVIPPNTYMSIEDGHLRLSPR